MYFSPLPSPPSIRIMTRLPIDTKKKFTLVGISDFFPKFHEILLYSN
jgi:hypothetical protein